jgi:hypothetical protein
MTTPTRAAGQAVVAVVLAVGLVVAVNVITVGILYDAIRNPTQAGISENATQILTGAFGGIVGVLGGFVGFAAGSHVAKREAEAAAAAEADEIPDDALPDDEEPEPFAGE